MQSIDRHQWEEPSWKKSSGSLAAPGMPDSLMKVASERSSQHFVYDDFNIPGGNSLKNKASGVADPRFRRVISPGMTDEIAYEARKVSESLARAAAAIGEEDKQHGNESASFARGSKIPTFLLKKNAAKSTGSQSPVPEAKSDAPEAPASRSVRTPKYEVFNGYKPEESGETKAVPKKPLLPRRSKTSKHHISSQQPKKSVSDCTLLTKNTSMGEEEVGSDCNKLQSFTSATRLSKVNNWMKEYRQEPEKRRSVITVIGQTQGKSFNTVLNEINQRRKLAKELDKHALCETILHAPEKEKEKEMKNVIAKVDFVAPDGKIIYTARKVYGFRESSAFESLLVNKDEEFPLGSGEQLKSGVVSIKLNDQIPERDVPASQARKRKTKRPTKKAECKKFDFKGASQNFLAYAQNWTVVSVAAAVCATLIVILLFSFKHKRILTYLNLGKPKSRSWYDEFF